MKLNVFLALFFIAAPFASGEIVERFLDYTIGDGEIYEAFIAYDDELEDLPVVYLAHQFFGVSDPEYFYARHWAEQGYFAFAGDVYTKAIRPETVLDAIGNSSYLSSNPDLLRFRANGALNAALNQPQVSLDEGAVIAGYCFGSDTAFELARTAPLHLKAAVGFHGTGDGLTGQLGQPSIIPADVWLQYHHAADDTATSDNDVAMFQQLAREMGIEKWSTHIYSNAAHGFTNPFSAIYNEAAAVLGHDIMWNMLQQIWPDTYTNRDFSLHQPENWKKLEQFPIPFHKYHSH